MNIIPILATIKEHKPKLDRSVGRFGLGKPWQVKLYIFSISFLLMGYLIAGPAILMPRRFPDFTTLGFITGLYSLGAVGLIIWGTSQISSLFNHLFKPTDQQLDGLKQQSVDEQALVGALTSFEEHDLEFTKNRLLFEITLMDLRSQFFFGTASTIAVVPVVIIVITFVRQLWTFNPYAPSSYYAMGTAGLVGLSIGALICKHVANNYRLYYFIIECAVTEKRRLETCR